MPNLDGGHYFLTVLAPIKVDTIVGPVVGRSYSHRQQLAQKLALLATGRQTAVSPENAWQSPFARNHFNHFTRLVIIDDPAFNGRISPDTLLAAVRDINPLKPQPVDRLTTPYLLFAADIDARGEDPVRSYTYALWETMSEDLKIIFGHCDGFDAVDSADKFYGYITQCQVETTMPFNDYWPDGFSVPKTRLPMGPVLWTAFAAGLSVLGWSVAVLLNGIFAFLGADGDFVQLVAKVVAWGAIVIPLLVGVVLLAAFVLLRWVLRRGAAPFPTAPGADLPTVLKALFLQQQFTRFAIQVQGVDDKTLCKNFGAFLAAVNPSDTEQTHEQTQKAGEVRAPIVGW
jgi:hypothetical protein